MTPAARLALLALVALAGCVGGEDASAATLEGARADVVAIPVAFEGTIPAHVRPCAFAIAAGTCLGVPPAAPEQAFVVDAAGEASGVSLRVTWAPTSPATQELAAFFYSSDGDELLEHASIVGPSPLVLAPAGNIQLREGWEHVILVAKPGVGAGAFVAGVGASAVPVAQPFVVEGAMDVRAAVPNP